MIVAAALLLQAAPSVAPTVCRWEERIADATVVHFGPDRDCLPWQTSRRHTGIWIFAFEWSQFVEGATTLDEALRADPHDTRTAWVSYDEHSGIASGCKPVLGQAYLIDFDGSDAVPPARRWPSGGGFGHMGLWASAVLIDHIRSMRLVGSLPEPQVRPKGVVARCLP